MLKSVHAGQWWALDSVAASVRGHYRQGSLYYSRASALALQLLYKSCGTEYHHNMMIVIINIIIIIIIIIIVIIVIIITTATITVS